MEQKAGYQLVPTHPEWVIKQGSEFQWEIKLKSSHSLSRLWYFTLGTEVARTVIDKNSKCKKWMENISWVQNTAPWFVNQILWVWKWCWEWMYHLTVPTRAIVPHSGWAWLNVGEGSDPPGPHQGLYQGKICVLKLLKPYARPQSLTFTQALSPISYSFSESLT